MNNRALKTIARAQAYDPRGLMFVEVMTVVRTYYISCSVISVDFKFISPFKMLRQHQPVSQPQSGITLGDWKCSPVTVERN